MTDTTIPYDGVFIVRNGERPISDWLRDGVIAVGWSKAKNLDKEYDRVRFKELMREAYRSENWTERALGNMAGSLFNFVHEIKIGKLVVVPVPQGFYVGEVTSNVFYDESSANDKSNSAWKRKVEWKSENPYPRNHASNTLQRRLKVRQTCVMIGDLESEVHDALNRKQPLSFSASVISDTRGAIANALRNAINDRQLEKLIMKLAGAAGATTVESPRNSSQPGDADFIAIYDLKIGNQPSLMKICYQVKQHEETTDKVGIQQIVDRMTADPLIGRGCLVTTATNVTGSAQELADENDIIIVKQEELIEWILMTGLSVLESI